MTLTCCGTAASWAADALPPAVCTRLRGLFGLDTLPDTLSEAVEAVEAVDGPADPAGDADGDSGDSDGAPDGRDVDALVDGLDDARGDHEVRFDGRTLALPTFVDALAVATLAESAATVGTVDPVLGEPVDVRVAADGGIDADWTDAALVTVGVGPGVWDGDEPTPADLRAELGPYVHAFASGRTARRWEGVCEESVATLDPADAAPLGRLLVGAPRDPAVDVRPWCLPDETAVLRSSRVYDGGSVRAARTAARRVDE